MGHCCSTCVLSDDLRGISRRFSGSTKVTFSGTGPRDNVALHVRKGNLGIIEGRNDETDTGGNVLTSFGLADLYLFDIRPKQILSGLFFLFSSILTS